MNTKIGERWDAAPLEVWAWLTLNNKPPPDMCYHVKFDSSASIGVC